MFHILIIVTQRPKNKRKPKIPANKYQKPFVLKLFFSQTMREWNKILKATKGTEAFREHLVRITPTRQTSHHWWKYYPSDVNSLNFWSKTLLRLLLALSCFLCYIACTSTLNRILTMLKPAPPHYWKKKKGSWFVLQNLRKGKWKLGLNTCFKCFLWKFYLLL